MLSFDIESKIDVLLELQELHQKTVEELEACSFEEHIIASKTLACRIKVEIVNPLINAIEICETVNEIGQENIPTELFNRWSVLIDEAIDIAR